MLNYSADLRVGELVRMDMEDMDVKRMLIHIKSSKGKKDRFIFLSKSVLRIFKQYAEQYRPKIRLFPCQNRKKYINMRTVGKIFAGACKREGIEKPRCFNTSGRSFATHSLENVIALGFSQKILGHKSSRQPKYTRMSVVSATNIGRIHSVSNTLDIKKIRLS